jgi:hypothetical protein
MNNEKYVKLFYAQISFGIMKKKTSKKGKLKAEKERAML